MKSFFQKPGLYILIGFVCLNLGCRVNSDDKVAYTAGIADHNAVALYDTIPAAWLLQVKTMLLSYPGESHGTGLLYGMTLLQARDSRFTAGLTWTGAPPAPTGTNLRITRTYWNGTAWQADGGEEDFWTSAEAVSCMDGWLTYAADTLHNPVHAFAFGWCWDMTAGTVAGGWAGDIYWPKNRANHLSPWDIGTTTPCLNDYLQAVAHYNQLHPATVTIYTTGPVDGGGNTGESGYQRALKHEAIRDWVRQDKDRWLFDYADILSYNDAGNENLITWNGHSFQFIHNDNYAAYGSNTANYNGGNGGCHINQTGCLRLAKAMWWLLARIAGWDGSST